VWIILNKEVEKTCTFADRHIIMPNELPQIRPAPQPAEIDDFAAYRATSQFYREVQSRQSFQQYCEWYYAVAERHRQELQQMRGEVNILGWFRF